MVEDGYGVPLRLTIALHIVLIHLCLGGIRTFHRADFQAVLTSHLPPTPLYATHFNKRLSSYAPTQNDPNTVTLTFADGTTATCDLLVGCDGIKSVVRGVLYRDSSTPVDPVWSGSVAYRSLIPQEVLKKVNPEHPSLTKGMMVSLRCLIDALADSVYFLVLWRK